VGVEIVRAERPDQVVVGTGVEQADDLGLRIPCTDDDCGRVEHLEDSRDVQVVDEVEQDQIGMVVEDGTQRRHRVRSSEDDMSSFAEGTYQRGTAFDVVLYQKQK
jgi:hypothetical protein